MAQLTYTYDASKIAEHGLDQMRFELGDTMVDGGVETCALSDQEYKAVIEAYPRWKRAKLACVESILRRFSYEVNTKVGELNLSLSDRLDYWKKLYSDLKADVSASAPLANPAAINGDHYFYAGMDFVIEPHIAEKSTTGRATAKYDTESRQLLRGVLSDASPEVIERFSQNAHPVTHQIAQRGRPKAKAGDRLLLENRAYYVEGVDPLGDLGLYTLYYVQQREDTHNGN